MAKKMTKKTLTRKTVIQFLIIILLLGTNIFTYYKYKTKNNPACELCLTEIEDTEGTVLSSITVEKYETSVWKNVVVAAASELCAISS